MTLSIRSLRLLCKKGDELQLFADRLSFFHGKMSTGKSTIVELINYCFGGRLVKTPAISSEVVRVQLLISSSDIEYLIERDADGSGSVDVSWVDGDVAERLSLPLAASTQPLYGEDIHNLSDFLMNLLGVGPIKVPTRKSDDDSNLHRLSFRDFYKFCYLDQPDLDSDFFHLATPIRREKSKDVLKFILGFQSERLTALQQELLEKRQEQRTLREAANQIDEFLAQYGYNSEEEIDLQIKLVDVQAEALEKEKEEQKSIKLPNEFSYDADRSRLHGLNNIYKEKLEAVSDIDLRIAEQEALRSELISLKIRAARNTISTEILDRAGFEACPQCGSGIKKAKQPHECNLCKTDLSDGEHQSSISIAVIEKDLADRIDDLKSSLDRLKNAKRRQGRSLEELTLQRRTIQTKMDAARKDLESEYLKRARQVESSLGALNERRRQLTKVRKMPAEIERRRKAADKLSEAISKLNREIEKETEKFKAGRRNLKELESNFLGILKAIRFPEISDTDKVSINPNTWVPYVLPKGDETRAWSFLDAGSGGKMVLFKTSFALALHKTAADFDLFVPKLFIVDSTMKNITPDINPEVFENFYKEVYRLLDDELKDWQCIIVDQTFYEYPKELEPSLNRRLTQDDPENPPLISYYKGH